MLDSDYDKKKIINQGKNLSKLYFWIGYENFKLKPLSN